MSWVHIMNTQNQQKMQLQDIHIYEDNNKKSENRE